MSWVSNWLSENGFAHLADAFEDHGIDAALLSELDGDDLRELGVERLGDRKRLLQAIGTLKHLDDPPASAATDQNTPSPDAERRQISILFCDLVGSTALSQALDPEDLREVMRAYQDRISRVVDRHGGHVANFLGDGVMAYFGWPRAQEMQAEAALRAGLAAVTETAAVALPTAEGRTLSSRVGIASGEVVVGDLIGAESRQTDAVIGETPNLAARLQGLAEPGSVILESRTRRLIGGGFDLVPLGRHRLKGLRDPVQAWQALRERVPESRFRARHAHDLTPLVGRDAERDTLCSAWSRTIAGKGGTVLLCGEAGIGKSRIIDTLRSDIGRDHGGILQLQCGPASRHSALQPVIDHIERRAGFMPDDASQDRLDKLESVLETTPTRSEAQNAALLAAMLSLPAGDRYPALNMSPQRQREETLAALIAQIVAGAQRQPVLLIVEDLHWIDPTTLELIDALVSIADTHSLLLVLSFRPEFEASWRESESLIRISPQRMTRTQSQALVEHLAKPDILQSAVTARIVERADGIPLFVEELTKAVLETGETKVSGSREHAPPRRTGSNVPSTLQDGLMARLDRLHGARAVAQIGAAIGREFDFPLLSRVSQLPEIELTAALQGLEQSELLFRQGQPPRSRYLFKHALVRDAAYNSLLRDRREAIHARIAAVIEEHQSERAARQPELLAQHWTAAGQAGRAIPLLISAAHLAMGRGAVVDALHHADQGLALLDGMTSDDARTAMEIGLQNARAVALIAPHGYADPNVQSAYARVRELCSAMADSPDLLPGLFAVSVSEWTAGRLEAAREQVDRILAIADAIPVPSPKVVAHAYAGSLLVHLGDMEASAHHLARAIALYDPDEHAPVRAEFGQDFGIDAYCWEALRLALRGDVVRSMALAEDTIALARRLNHPFSLVMALDLNGQAALTCRDHERAIAWGGECTALCRDQRIAVWEDWSGTVLQIGHLLSGDRKQIKMPLQAHARVLDDIGYRVMWGQASAALALAAIREGDESLCREFLLASETFSRRHPDVLDLHTSLWFRGQTYEALGDRDRAIETYDDLISLSRRHRTPLGRLRGSLAKANVLAADGQRAEARALLSDTLASVPPECGGCDLNDANALLASLS